MKQVLNFIVLSNLFISTAVALFTWQTLAVFMPINEEAYNLILVNFIATFVLYNAQRLFYSAKNEEEVKYAWYNKNRRLLFTLIVLLIMLCFNFLWRFLTGNHQILIYYFCFGLFSLLYFLPPLQLRRIGVLKPFFIAVVYVAVGIIIPLNKELNYQALIYSVAQFLFIAALCLLFDIRDLDFDRSKGIKTIPVLIGEKYTRIVVLGIMHAYIGLIVFIDNKIIITPAVVAFCLTVVLTLFASSRRSNFYYLGLVDGVIIAQGALTIWLST